ncbi:Re/Si-specific NAD(P)(+) transhydrogenase subunit alpha [Cellulomonas sp. zg-ZUI222]|uniref:proton-translocating NAD(P)(+) transhydrogenase n=1 Tax=Cellulomonas wangleii TaxID=2816956 RepID=A0ABX8D6Z5_9CELL|nr:MULTISPECIES: Re/Si-specific NAD(P)(+) transhydrogenase subunit alpha [Cellulomonas]MBO0901667.1 Re/Si-specific NAD(P)(+) transhydrogenase subunit alpha [Cellulomonas sp. zg-ZUI22]MBO0922214.1 Re/Si-specific NAD(P)(+) transhydrogenase subunit alpha [Cellulomonas wangleii]MBO0925909.1 Re/Si-specific NAD(P)(+) transhydrogenase subunit alpha [Cellulomonas wangleii]QVI63216.1 Re/Si-specific NAD(P)(+) transhydrogenase subunit alpha [Cellulomonas wangleii]
MRIGVPREQRPGERLVAATPATVAKLSGLGYDVLVEHDAGAAATFTDDAYRAAGATVTERAEVMASDVVTAVHLPADVGTMRRGATLVATMAPFADPGLAERLAALGITALALDAVPRISRAQALDVLSTLSNVAGYRAVIEAAEEFGGMFTGQMTAAGKTPPANVFVIGAGVAGLAALGTASSLGAQVRAFDVRPEVGEQIESMGATFVQAEGASQEVSTDGYARELTAEQERLTAQMYAEQTAWANVVVTTALVRGQAPRTITKEMVAAMRPGSVIVDLAASGGGNCELTVPGERVVSDNGVIILGYTDLPSRMPQHTSQLFGTNVVHLLALLTPGKDGELVLDLDDPVQRGMTVTTGGDVTWPPPPVAVSAAPAAVAPAPVETPEEAAAKKAAAVAAAQRRGRRNAVLAGLGAVLTVLALTAAPASFLGHATVFALAVVVGYYVISNVSHSLHTPLMATTNAISGIILVGALLQIGHSSWVVSTLAFVAATVAAINIFGGFLVAFRMIHMFRKEA